MLMSNHYHLMVERPEANLVAGMRWLQNTYTRRHNCRHRLWGRLFDDRWATAGLVKCRLMTARLLTFVHLYSAAF
jgi:REP element-mobilizing transposase RayT